MLSLLSFLPPPLFLLTPLTGVESYQTKWHLRNWLGSFSHLCLEMVACPSCLIGSSWQLLPPIGPTRGLPNMTSWLFWDAGGPTTFYKSKRCTMSMSSYFCSIQFLPFFFTALQHVCLKPLYSFQSQKKNMSFYWDLTMRHKSTAQQKRKNYMSVKKV